MEEWVCDTGSWVVSELPSCACSWVAHFEIASKNYPSIFISSLEAYMYLVYWNTTYPQGGPSHLTLE